jgi:cell division protease FtsH
MTKALLEWETLDADQINDIMAGKPPRPPKPVAKPVPPSDGGGGRAAEPTTTPVENA